jgi:hypothetical protein
MATNQTNTAITREEAKAIRIGIVCLILTLWFLIFKVGAQGIFDFSRECEDPQEIDRVYHGGKYLSLEACADGTYQYVELGEY